MCGDVPAYAVARALRQAGYVAYAAGGSVRDFILKRPFKDIDIATSATPSQIEALFPRTVAVGKAFGVIVVMHGETPVEVATFRTDGDYTDGRHPDSVRFTSPQEDASRRDFTINGLFMDTETREVIDFVGGQSDIAAGIVRAIGDPAARFRDDRLRMLRAVRFAGTLGFGIDPATAEAIRALCVDGDACASISAERIGQEVVRIFTESRDAGQSLQWLSDLGLLRHILPEVEALRGVEQPPEFHPEGDVFVHTRLMLKALPPPPRDPRLGLAVLLHDVGKPPAFQTLIHAKTGLPRITFRRHADIGEQMASEILQRLKLPNAIIRDVASMVGRHMRFINIEKMRTSTLRRFMAASTFPLEMELTRLDQLCSNGDLTFYLAAKEIYETYRDEVVLPPRWVTGDDLLALGMKEGPALGKLLKRAYDRQLEGTSPDREALLAWARKFAKRI